MVPVLGSEDPEVRRERYYDNAGRRYAREPVTHALSLISSEEARDISDQKKPICLVPPTVKGDDCTDYYSFGPGALLVRDCR